jgi:oxygen-independent coproporphyrinogen-3 oxidase
MLPYSLYLHIPFCRHRCAYCDFNTYAGLEQLIPPYLDALCREAQFLASSAGARLPVHTIFFGGGTPSLLPPGEIGQILRSFAC